MNTAFRNLGVQPYSPLLYCMNPVLVVYVFCAILDEYSVSSGTTKQPRNRIGDVFVTKKVVEK